MSKGNHLKLMVDYCLNEPGILRRLNDFGNLDIKTTIECGYSQGEKDEVLIWEGTLKHDRILLTRDYRTINEAKYTPCKHGGVIIVRHARPDENVVHAFVKTLMQCGERKHVKGHFTRLRRDGIEIITHDKEPVIVHFSDNPNLRKIVAGI